MPVVFFRSNLILAPDFCVCYSAPCLPAGRGQSMENDLNNELSNVVEAADEADSSIARIYEVGYLASPAVKEEDLEKVVGGIRSFIESVGGSFIAEGAPSLMKLAYVIDVREGGKREEYDRAYFGWIKFESPAIAAHALGDHLKQNTSIVRSIVFKTVREDTRAQLKTGGLREVKRTDTIKTTPRRETPAQSGEVSEADLEKALEDITAE